MKPTAQTVFGKKGNCFSAAVASVLEIPIEKAPYIVGRKSWINYASGWARRRKMEFVIWPSSWNLVPYGYAVAIGFGGRGFNHAVVTLDGRQVFDPHPKGDLLNKIMYHCAFVRKDRLSRAHLWMKRK